MIEVMDGISAISKDKRNQAQGYNFRGIDDVYNELHDTMSKAKVFCTSKIISERSEEKPTKSGGFLMYRILHIEFSFFTTDGSSVTTQAIGEGMDSGDKASNKAMSVAQKYALIQAFLIPTIEAKDPENDSHDLAPPPRTESKQVDRSVADLCAKLKDENIDVDAFIPFLVENKMIKSGQFINDLSASWASQMMQKWGYTKEKYLTYASVKVNSEGK